MSVIEEFLSRADVPEMRKDITKPENIKWLVNNLGVRNSDIAGFPEAATELKRLHIKHVRISLPPLQPLRTPKQEPFNFHKS